MNEQWTKMAIIVYNESLWILIEIFMMLSRWHLPVCSSVFCTLDFHHIGCCLRLGSSRNRLWDRDFHAEGLLGSALKTTAARE